MNNKILVKVLLSAYLMCGCGSEEEGPLSKIAEEKDFDGRLSVAIARQVPGNFIVGGHRYGYSYELLNAYAADRGFEMELSTGRSASVMTDDLTSGGTDIVVALSTAANGDAVLDGEDDTGQTISLPLYSTKYVMLARKTDVTVLGRYGDSPSSMMGGRMVMVSSGFELTESYDKLLDSVFSAQVYVSPREGFELARSLSRHEFDLLVCENSEAMLAEEILRDVVRVYEFGEEVDVSLIFDAGNEALRSDFCEWFVTYSSTANYAALSKMYLDKEFVNDIRRMNKPNRVVGGISVWDELIRKVGAEQGVDWRLLSAIAYNESRFRNDVVSTRGAQGIMQIMPVVARHFSVDEEHISDPEVNLTLAAKLLKSIDGMLGLDEEVSDYDRLGITLAAYNCGIGVVSSARRLAVYHGESPDSWESVSQYLRLMGDSSFACDVSYRRFNGSGETLAFVGNVVERYDTYCRAVP